MTGDALEFSFDFFAEKISLGLYGANDMKIFISSSESPLKVRKIAVYRFLMSFLVLKLLRFKGLKNCGKKWHEKCAVIYKINQN